MVNLENLTNADIKKVKEIRVSYPDLSFAKLGERLADAGGLSILKSPGSLRKAIPKILEHEIHAQTSEWNLPEGKAETGEPYALYGKVIAILNDIHIPFHDKNALTLALKECERRNVDTIVLNGDALDCMGASRFTKDPKYRSLSEEFKIFRQFLDVLREKFPNQHIVYKLGNHEERVDKYIWDNAEALDGLFSFDSACELTNKRIDLIKDKRLIVAGKLNILHGHEMFAGAGMINVARQMRLKAGENICVGHFHKTQTDITQTLRGKIQGAYAMGCLCNLRPLYMPYNQWNHGFGIVEMADDGTFSFENLKIINGKVTQ